MELRHLRYFVAIAEERSITRAAERLWVAQPGLSTQMRRLETELGVKLFERHTRGVDLTEAGKLFLERARVALEAADFASATGRDLEAGLVGSIRLGIATEAAWGPAAGLLDDFAREHPDVELTVVESSGGTLVRDLHDGRLDAVLAPSPFAAPDLVSTSLAREPWLVLAGADHPLAAVGEPISASELDGETIVVSGHRDGVAYDRAVIDMLADLGVTPVVERAASGPARLMRVMAGDALALGTTAPAGDATVARRLEPERSVEFALLSRNERPAPALDKFMRAAASAAEQRPRLRVVA
jgi:DNA-binding transcriptional LysR family regulator